MKDENVYEYYKMYYHEFFIPIFKHLKSLGFAKCHWDVLRGIDVLALDSLEARRDRIYPTLRFLQVSQKLDGENFSSDGDQAIKILQEKLCELDDQIKSLEESLDSYD